MRAPLVPRFFKRWSRPLAAGLAVALTSCATAPSSWDRLWTNARLAPLPPPVAVLDERDRSLPDGRTLRLGRLDLPTVVSAPNQTLDAVVLERTGPMARFTQLSGFEACARVCKAPDGRWAWTVQTVGSRLGCMTTADACPAGFEPTETSVHTHPLGWGGMASTGDVSVDPTLTLGQWLPLGDPFSFSPTDLDGSAGYLVAPDGWVLAHDGRRAVRTVRQGAPPHP